MLRFIEAFCKSGIILLLLLMTAGCGSGGGGSSSTGDEGTGISVTLTWDAPTKNTDGSDLTDLLGYRVHYGTSSGIYAKSLNVGAATTRIVGNLLSGRTYYFAVKAYDASGNESAYSNEVEKDVL